MVSLPIVSPIFTYPRRDKRREGVGGVNTEGEGGWREGRDGYLTGRQGVY
jgi:hypothetical protein